MGEDDAQIAFAHRLARLDIFRAFQAQHDTSHHACQARYGKYRNGNDGVDRTRSQHRDDGDGKQQAREGEQNVDEPADNRIDPAAEIAGAHAEEHTNQRAGQHAREADGQRHTRAVNHARQRIAAQIVRAERMLHRHRAILLHDALFERVNLPHQRAENRNQHEQDEDSGGDHGDFSAHEPAQHRMFVLHICRVPP